MDVLKRFAVILSVVFSALLSSVIMVFIHEGGHALCCLLCGGRVAGFSFIPQLTYAAYTEIDFTQTSLTFGKHLFVSIGGYLFVLIATIILVFIGIKANSVIGIDCFIMGLVLSVVSVGQFIYAIVGICSYMKNGAEVESDVVCTIALYPDKWLICYIATVVLLLVSAIVLTLTIFQIKNRLSLLVDMVY